MATEMDSQDGSEVGTCVELSVVPELDSADIIPEAAMKCGILPLDGATTCATDLGDDDALSTDENLRLYLQTVSLSRGCTYRFFFV